jgi:hypothetical protein
MNEIRTSELNITYTQLASLFCMFLQYVFAVLLSRFLRYFAQVFQLISAFCWCYMENTDKGEESDCCCLLLPFDPHTAVSTIEAACFLLHHCTYCYRILARPQNCTKTHTCFSNSLLPSLFLSCLCLSIGACRLFMHDASSSNQSTSYAAIACPLKIPGPLHKSCRSVGPASAAIRSGVRERQNTVAVGMQESESRAIAISSKTPDDSKV